MISSPRIPWMHLLLGAIESLVVLFPASLCSAAPDDPLHPWKTSVKVTPVSGKDHHSIHSYFNTSPESPDGRWILFYASTAANGHQGEIRIRERQTGKETVLARDISVEDAHRAACQQWVSRGQRVVFHNVLASGEWVVIAVDIKTGKDRLLARGRQLAFGQPDHDIVPLYGPHWNPGKHRGLELLNVATGEIQETGLTPAVIKAAFPDWVKQQFGEKEISVFFPILSPDIQKVFFKLATPAGGDFRSRSASIRHGLLCYDLKKRQLLPWHARWGHPSWHPQSREILDVGGKVIDSNTGKTRQLPNQTSLRGSHPSFSPDGKLFTTDVYIEGKPFNGPRGFWAVLVGDVRTGKYVVLHRFDNSKGAQSWRVSHPHPVFSRDGKRIYFNVSDGPWTRLLVAAVP